MAKKPSEKYKAIIFDLDGTLINSLPYHLMAFKDLMLERGFRVPDKDVEKMFGRPSREIFKFLMKKYKFKGNIEDMREERRYHYFKFLGTRNIIFPGIIKTLVKLRLNYKIAVATGSSYVTYSHSTDLDFRNLFDFTSTINDLKRGKPYPDQLFYVMKHLKVKPQECLIIGDSMYDGIAAKRAGADFIGVTSGYTSAKELRKYEPLIVLKSVNELGKFFNK